MALETKLTKKLGIKHPILLAPMGYASGGKLAAAVSNAGGFGIVGGGYGDTKWIEEQAKEAKDGRIGFGFITWSLDKNPALLDQVLNYRPLAVMLSFGDPNPYADKIRSAGAKLICQVQCLNGTKDAIKARADIIIAQGTEAGGHGKSRGTISLTREVVSYVKKNNPETVVISAGGFADGESLAAALCLGSEGVLVGSRFWVSKESLAHEKGKLIACNAGGDQTVKCSVVDVARQLEWPEGYEIRTLENEFVNTWQHQTDILRNRPEEIARYAKARDEGDFSIAPAIVGEAVGVISTVLSAEEIIDEMVRVAEETLSRVQKITSI